MHSRIIPVAIVGLLCLIIAGLGQNPRVPLDPHRSLGQPKSYRNLTLIPVYDSQAAAGNSYTTLDEGLKAKTVQVSESPGGGDVNKLYITNRGKRPLYLMAGEVVLGGQQDRCLGQDTVVQSGRKRVPVAVFCVEHGRWTGRAQFESSAMGIASADIRSSAQDGVFKAASTMPAAMAGRIANGRARSDQGAAVAVDGLGARVLDDQADRIEGREGAQIGLQQDVDPLAVDRATRVEECEWVKR